MEVNVQTVLPAGFPTEEERQLVLFGNDRKLAREYGLDAPIEERAGRCYEMALGYAAFHSGVLGMDVTDERLKLKVVHGSIQGMDNPRIGHAWVELTDPRTGKRMALDPAWSIFMKLPRWNKWTNPTRIRFYTSRGVGLMAIKHEHSGPYHPKPFGIEDCPHGTYPASDCEHGCDDETLKGDEAHEERTDLPWRG